MDCDHYEDAVLSKIRHDYYLLEVRPKRGEGKFKARGRHSLALRQLDVAVYRRGVDYPSLIVDAKKPGRKVDVKQVEMVLGMAEDVGAQAAAIVCPSGFTKSAKRRARAAGGITQVLTISDALQCRWLETARDIWPGDPTFHPNLAEALRSLEQNKPPGVVVDVLESLPWDEWDGLFTYLCQSQPKRAQALLDFVVDHIPDYDWRGAALIRLYENGWLPETRLRTTLSADPTLAALVSDVIL